MMMSVFNRQFVLEIQATSRVKLDTLSKMSHRFEKHAIKEMIHSWYVSLMLVLIL